MTQIRLQRSPRNPILTPSNLWWENRAVSNAGVVLAGGKVHLFYTAKGEDGLARLGYAKVNALDHVEERQGHPIFTPQEWYDQDGVEDPRLTVLDGRVYMIYTGKDKDMARPCEASIALEDLVKGFWAWSQRRLLLPTMVSIHNRNVAYFPRKIGDRYALLHRPMLLTEYLWLSYSYDRVHWYDHKELLRPRPGYWDDAKIGVAGPPIEMEEGWLLIYHGVEARTWTYRLGALLLEREQPERVLWRSEEPLLEPERDYERHGVSPNVVFSCGAIVMDRTLVVYYGAADQVIGVATAELPWTPINTQG